MNRIVYFHRNINSGYSINKVTQGVLKYIEEKKEFYVPGYHVTIKDILNNLFFVYKNREKGSINHITGDIHYCILALIGCKSVLTIHDTVTLDYHNYSWLKSKIIEFLWFRLPLRFATKIVCITNETKQQVQKYTNRTDLAVINNPVDEELLFCERSEMSNTPKILLIGTNDNKNVVRTIEALDGIDCVVTIVGKLKESQLITLQRLNIHYINKYDLSDQEIRNEYYNTDIVSFCSLFEGFGMPAIEANKAGRVLLCSDLPVLRYVANDAAFYVDPYSVEQIKQGFLTLINDKEIRVNLVKKGLENAKRFEPNKLALQWKKLYNSL